MAKSSKPANGPSFFAGVDSDRAVLAGRQHIAAAKNSLEHRPSVTVKYSQSLTGRPVPYPHALVLAGGHDKPAIRTEDRAIDITRVTFEWRPDSPSFGFPHGRRPITARRGQESIVGAKGHTGDLAVMALNPVDNLPLFGIPYGRDAKAPRRQPLPIMTIGGAVD